MKKTSSSRNDSSSRVLEDGHIGGLNGVLLGVAAESGLHGACLLGEMPHMFAQLPFPKASLAVLKAFAAIAGIRMDYTEITEQAKHMDKELGKFLGQMEANAEQQSPADEEAIQLESSGDEGIGLEDRGAYRTAFRPSRAGPLKRLRAQGRAGPA